MSSNMLTSKGEIANDSGGSKILIGHVAIELIVISGLSYYFNNKVSVLSQENTVLRGEVETLKDELDNLKRRVDLLEMDDRIELLQH